MLGGTGLAQARGVLGGYERTASTWVEHAVDAVASWEDIERTGPSQAQGEHPCVPSTELHFCLQSPWDVLPGSSCSAGVWPLAAQVSRDYWGAGEPKVNPGGLFRGLGTSNAPVPLWGPASSRTINMWGLGVTLDLPSHPALLPQMPWPRSCPESPSCGCQQSSLAQVRDPRGHGRA